MRKLLENDLPREEKIKRNNVGKELEAKLNKIYPPDARIDTTFKGKDLTLFTDFRGQVTSFHYGKRNRDGNISGDRFFRREKPAGPGLVHRHWDKQK